MWSLIAYKHVVSSDRSSLQYQAQPLFFFTQPNSHYLYNSCIFRQLDATCQSVHTSLDVYLGNDKSIKTLRFVELTQTPIFFIDTQTSIEFDFIKKKTPFPSLSLASPPTCHRRTSPQRQCRSGSDGSRSCSMRSILVQRTATVLIRMCLTTVMMRLSYR